MHSPISSDSSAENDYFPHAEIVGVGRPVEDEQVDQRTERDEQVDHHETSFQAHGRMADPLFARRVAERRAEHLVSLAGRFSELTERAVGTIEELMDSGLERTRLAAARLVVEWAARLRHAEDLAVAVAEIREHLGLGDADAHRP